MTYQVFTKEGFPVAVCSTLDQAMEKAKILGEFVKIKCADGTEFVGKFGADTVKDGMTPDGYIYEWKKEFSLKKRKNDMTADKQ